MIDLSSVIIDHQIISAIGRILFGAVLTAKFISMIELRDFIWARRFPNGVVSDQSLKILLYFSVCFSFLLTIGFLTGIMALICTLIILFLMKDASIYTMEDTFCQILAFYFIIAGSGQILSIDSLVGWHLIERFPGAQSLFPEFVLAVLIGIVFTSAGVEKLLSPMWRNGFALYRFLSFPGQRRFSAALLRKNKTLVLFLNYTALLGEAGILLAMFINGFPIGFLFVLSVFFIGVFISTLFVFTWLGELIIISTGIVFWLLFQIGSDSLLSIWWQTHEQINSQFSIIIFWGISFSLFAALWVGVIPHIFRNKTFRRPIYEINLFLRYVARYVWGLVPVELFSEKHLTEQTLYKTFVSLDGKKWDEVVHLWKQNGLSGSFKELRPIHIRSTRYKLTEVSMELDKFNKIESENRRKMLDSLVKYAIKRGEKDYGYKAKLIKYKILQIPPPAGFIGDDENWYSHLSWEDSILIKIENTGEISVKKLKDKILNYPTGRNITRDSYSFNPNKI